MNLILSQREKCFFKFFCIPSSSTCQQKQNILVWNSRSYEVEQIQAMAVVHIFPSTSWLEATDGTSNSSFSQSPAPAPSAPASTWHHNEEDQLGKEKASGGAGQTKFPQYGATCKKEYKEEHDTRAHAHAHMDGCVVSCDSGDHREGTVEENNERQLNYLDREFRSSRDTSFVQCFFLTKPK